VDGDRDGGGVNLYLLAAVPYANAVGDLIAEAFPRTWELFVEAAGGE
jgi:hypothetical protein